MITLLWWASLLLLPLPWLVRMLLPAAKTVERSALRVPFFDNVKELGGVASNKTTRRGLARILPMIIWICLVIATARPHYIGDPIQLPSEGRDLMLAVDVSQSMNMQDLQIGGKQVDRLSAVKSVLEEFIERRESDRLGLILFGTHAYIQTPLTFDRQTVNTLLMESAIGIAGPHTAIGEAIGLSLKRLKDRPTDSKVLVLLTDGANTAGEISPLQAAKLAASQELKIYTVGVGADEMIQPGIFGSRFGQRKINPSADLDEKTLKAIADMTGGQYFRARNTKELEGIYSMLDTLEPIASDEATFRPRKSLFFWPLGLALVLSALMALIHILPQLSLGSRGRPNGHSPATNAKTSKPASKGAMF